MQTEARKTAFRERLRSFADIHRIVQEDLIISLFQQLCVSVVNLDWTSSGVDETKLTLAQNLVCVDKYYKRWKESWNSVSGFNPRSPKSLLNSNNSPTNSTTTPKKGSVSPTDNNTPLISKLEGLEFDEYHNNNNNNTSHRSPPLPSSSPSSTSPPSSNSGTWTSPENTRSKLDLKKKNAEITHYTIESKYKAIKELVERTAKSINEKRSVNFVLLWLLIENTMHADTIKINTAPILELISHFKRELNNSFQVFPELQGVKETGESDLSELLSYGFGTSSNTNNIPINSLSITTPNSTISASISSSYSSSPLSSSVASGNGSINTSSLSSSVPNGGASPLKTSDEPVWRASIPKGDKPGRKPSQRAGSNEPKEAMIHSRVPPHVMLRANKPAEILKEGWMKKQGTKKSKAWKRRYFILSSEAILGYFECSSRSKGGMMTLTSPHSHHHSSSSVISGTQSPGPQSSGEHPKKEKEGGNLKVIGKMKGSLDIWTATQIGNIKDPDSSIPPSGAFGIETPGRTLKLWCESEKDMEDWLEVLLKIRAQSRW